MNPYSGQSQPHLQSQGINPALLGNFPGGNVPQNKYNPGPQNHMMNGMNMNMGQGPMGNMNNMGLMGMNQMAGGNPGQFHPQQPQQQMPQHLQQRGMMNGMNPMMNAGGGMNNMMSSQLPMGMMSGGGRNPAGVSSPSSQPMSNPMNSMMNMGMGPMSAPMPNMMNSNPMMGPSNGSAPAHNMLGNSMGGHSMNMMGSQMPQNMGMGNMGHDMGNMMNNNFGQVPNMDRQNTPQKMMMQMPPQQQHSPPMPHQQPPMFDRPPSSASMQSSQPHMMAPPPRPPTAQSSHSASGISRPGTSMSMRSRGGPAPSPSTQQRPPSRSAGENGMAPGQLPNGFQHSPVQMNKGPSTPQMPPPSHPMANMPPSASPPGSPSLFRAPSANIPGAPQLNAMNPLKRKVSESSMNGMAGHIPPGMNGFDAGPNMAGMAGMGPMNGVSMMGGMSPMRPTPNGMPPPSIQPPQDMMQSPTRQGSLPPSSIPPTGPNPIVKPGAPKLTSLPPAAAVAGPALINIVPGLPPGVKANPAITRVTNVPLVGSDKTIPEIKADEIPQIQEWMKEDQEYEARMKAMRDRMMTELRNEVVGPSSLKWWDKGASTSVANARRNPREIFDIRYPSRHRRDREAGRSRKGGKREGFKLPRVLHPDDANRPEVLVPIRLEFDVDPHKMRDTFVWNLNDPVIKPEHFAQTLVEDYNLPAHFHATIVKTIQEQLADYKQHSFKYDPEGAEYPSTHPPVQSGDLDEQSAAWWESWRQTLRKKRLSSRGKRKDVHLSDGFDTMDSVKTERNVGEEREDMRVLIKLDITVGSVKLDDQFEWDLENETLTPEDFAVGFARDLGLGGEFLTAISHSIREQIQTFQKSLFLIGHPSDGTAVQDEDLKSSFLPPLVSAARSLSEILYFTPQLTLLTDNEMERNEKEREKDMNRRRKRNTRGRRGVALPDREPIRTCRTPALGFPEPDAAALALQAAANAPVSRRAAAAAASLTIANMVASENGTPFPMQTVATPSAPTPTAKPRKHIKGLFKPPPVPATVLRAQAFVQAPTASTAADGSKLPGSLDTVAPPSTHLTNERSSRSTVRKGRDNERDAKALEFADGQHANIISGVWHCSNCGCPESIAVGRRKGPLGDKSQCGTCGKYWHRHRRPRPVEYNTDPDFHLTTKPREAETIKPTSKRKGPFRGQSVNTPEPSTPSRVKNEAPHSPIDDDRAMSPVSTVSSESEAPLSVRAKRNGAPTPKRIVSPPLDTSSEPATTTSSIPSSVDIPPWLTNAMEDLQAMYPDDRFQPELRAGGGPPAFRMRCVDCPLKAYNPGPGHSLQNFEVHLKNRQHRERVDTRVG